MRPRQQNDIFHAIAHPARRTILDRLRRGEKPAGELVAFFGVTFSAISQHLKILKDAGLVIDEAAGARRLYRAAPGGMMALRTWLDDFWNQVFADYQAEIQRQMDERRYS